MTTIPTRSILSVTAALVALAGAASAAQDRFTLKVPDGLAFSEFRGYDMWQDVASSATASSVKAILANPAMIKAYQQGIPGNGKSFPDGSKIVKIEWLKKKNLESPYAVDVPDTLASISLIEKDSKRFPDTSGWAYAKFLYDPATQTFKAVGTGSACGYACHTAVKAKDYIFTAYPPR